MRTRLSISDVLLTAFLGLLLATSAFGQRGNGGVFGTVTDPTGALVPGASTTLINTQTGIQKTVDTNTAGIFQFGFVTVGTYNLKVVAKGFSEYEWDGLIVTVGK